MVNPLRSPMTVYLKSFLGAHADRLRVHWRAGERGASAVELAIITGAEGGFAAEDAEMAAKAGAKTVGLGPRILRCETAPLAVVSAVMTLTGNLEYVLTSETASRRGGTPFCFILHLHPAGPF